MLHKILFFFKLPLLTNLMIFLRPISNLISVFDNSATETRDSQVLCLNLRCGALILSTRPLVVYDSP
ncbi:hypothetical protein CAAN1_16S00100 [[Candida] anglica]|uniref:Secreted protein n=1 Tax=[Candida] anglica TaxID=148631 RepID=A0ABP0ED76_9ASCO